MVLVPPFPILGEATWRDTSSPQRVILGFLETIRCRYCIAYIKGRAVVRLRGHGQRRGESACRFFAHRLVPDRWHTPRVAFQAIWRSLLCSDRISDVVDRCVASEPCGRDFLHAMRHSQRALCPGSCAYTRDLGTIDRVPSPNADAQDGTGPGMASVARLSRACDDGDAGSRCRSNAHINPLHGVSCRNGMRPFSWFR